MAAVGIVERADITLGGDGRSQFTAIHQARAGIAVAPRKVGLPGLKFLPLALLDGGQHPAVYPVAVDLVALDALPQQHETAGGNVPDPTRILDAAQSLEATE